MNTICIDKYQSTNSKMIVLSYFFPIQIGAFKFFATPPWQYDKYVYMKIFEYSADYFYVKLQNLLD